MKNNIYIAIAISTVILIASFFILLELFFIEDIKVETYTCRLSESDKRYHNVNCNYSESSYRTTVYQAEKNGYGDGCFCNPFNKASEITLYLQKRHYIPPAIISISIAVAIFLVIKPKSAEKKHIRKSP